LTYAYSEEFEDVEIGRRGVYPDDTGDGEPEDFTARGPGWLDTIKNNSWFAEMRFARKQLWFTRDRIDLGIEYRFIDQYYLMDVENIDYEGDLFGGKTPWTEHPDWWNTPAEQEVFSGYIQYQTLHKFFQITTGVRYDNFRTTPTDLEVRPGYRKYEFRTLNPRATVIVKPTPKTDIKFIYATGFRNPSFREFFNQPAESGDEILPDLKPEKIQSYEISCGYLLRSGTRTRINVFHNDLTDRLQRVAVSATGSPLFTNAGEIKGYGLEFELEQRWKSGYAFFNYTYLDMKDEAGRSITAMAANKFNVGSIVNFKTFSASAWFNFIGERQGRNIEQTEQGPVMIDDRTFPAYGLLNLKVSLRNLPSQGITWELISHNVLDECYKDPADVAEITGEYPREGRSVWLGLRLSL
ncbi:TonB-dependent receptor domain-containing protein, partial [candidate division CSSED10-310 bacterium]